ncbi:unnamed protein product [Sympodiomycopsis kandeliae]
MTEALVPPTSYDARPSGKLTSKTRHSIDLADLTPNNIGTLRMLNSVLFPVKYSDGFYKDALLEERKRINKLALFNDIPVGNLVCRYEFSPPSETSSSSSLPSVQIYIMTLGVLAPYRRLGIASYLINHILSEVTPGSNISLPESNTPPKDKKDPTPIKTKEYLVEKIYLHVQTDNQQGRQFYKNLGFTEADLIEQYYREGVQCRSAVVLEKRD